MGLVADPWHGRWSESAATKDGGTQIQHSPIGVEHGVVRLPLQDSVVTVPAGLLSLVLEHTAVSLRDLTSSAALCLERVFPLCIG